jgi:catechol 2,3-dioxygenase-like lactoylglutathione lyase family enzyme
LTVTAGPGYNVQTLFTGIHHLAFIAADLDATVRFWRDLLGLPLSITTGDDGGKHYFFQITETDAVAFFWWPGAQPIVAKPPGVSTLEPRGFDHVAIGVATRADLYAVRDRLVGAGVEVAGPIDHGLTLSIYFTDPNALSVEVAWQRVDVLAPLHLDRAPVPAAISGSRPSPERWPQTRPVAGLPDVARVDPQAAQLVDAEARGLVRQRGRTGEAGGGGRP